MNYDDFLAHFGIKGMKWGIRRTPEQLGYKTSSPSNKKIKKMSDDELRKAVNRLQMEKQYRDLKSEEIKRGRTKSQKIMQDISDTNYKAVKTALGTVATAYATYKIGEWANKKAGVEFFKQGKKKK